MNLNRVAELKAEQMRNKKSKAALIKKAEAAEKYFREILQEFDIPAESVHYEEPPEGSSTKYYAGKRSSYFTALELKIQRNKKKKAWMLADAGNELKYPKSQGGGSIFYDIGIQNVGTLPPDAHHAVNPLDSHAHGSGKATWRTEMNGVFIDDVRSTVCLMRCLLDIEQDKLRRWFEEDLAWKKEDREDDVALEAACKKIVAGNTSKWEEHHEYCLAAYYAKFPKAKPKKAQKEAPKRKKNEGSVVVGVKKKKK